VGAHPDFWKTTNGRGEYITTIMTNVGNAPCEATPWTMKFVNAYRTKYGINPEGSFADIGYMGVYILKDAIERAGTIKSDAVVKALEKTDMMGVYGRMRFNPKYHDLIFAEDPAEGAMIGHTQWQAGKMLVVYPPSIANGEIKLPPWMKK
jgi:branched-chain amino acid transport system substrate-binding protein